MATKKYLSNTGTTHLINKIADGTLMAGSAKADSDGNKINETYLPNNNTISDSEINGLFG